MENMKILTHAGTHHADEVLAIATIHELLGECEVIRTYDREQVAAAQQNPDVWVLDIGRKYDELNNFDHHQDANIAATNLLVLRALSYKLRARVQDKLREHLFNYVDQVDRGEIVEGRDIQAPTFNAIIRSCNALNNGFDVALSIARATFRAALAQARKAVDDERRWKREVFLFGRYAVLESNDPIAGWHELAERDGVIFLVTPNKRGGWQIISRDSGKFPIPADDTQTFLHNSGFLAAYPSREHAIGHAMAIADTVENL